MELSTYGPNASLYAAAHSAAYLVFATILILANKHLITETSLNCPIFVSSLGSWFGWGASAFAARVGWTKLSHELTFGEWFASILPIGACTALSLSAANVAYSYLSLSFIQMLKAFAPVVTYFTLVAFGLDRWSARILITLGVVTGGCFLAAYGEAHVTLFGLACMLVAEVSEAFRSVGVQYLIANRKFSLFNGMYYFSPATLVFLMLLSFIFERDEVFKSGNTETMREYWYLLLVCATFGFAVNYVCLGVVKHAGSLMVKTMSQLKNVVVIAAAVVIYGDDVSKLEMIGYAIAVVGFLAFNRAKALDNAVVRDILSSSEKVDASYPESESESLLGRHPSSIYRGSESA